MTEYMKEVIEWMFGSKCKNFEDDELDSPEYAEYHKQTIEVYERCAPFITDKDFKEGVDYVYRTYGGIPLMAMSAYEKKYILPAREKQKQASEPRVAYRKP